MLEAVRQIESLNDLVRTGWKLRGLPDGETVGEHTMACIAILERLADELGGDFDLDHAIEMLVVHDWPESKKEVGDITVHCNVPPEEKFRREKEAMVELCAELEHGERFLALWLEFEEQKTAEARIARQIDKFQVVYQAVCYHVEHGLDPTAFFVNDAPRVTHPVLVAFIERLRAVVSMAE